MEVTSEGHADETISLSDVLVTRDSCLPEDELWALCRECCLVLEVVNNSPDMFQTLCVTPDTVAFDQVGNVCFLDLDIDPEPIYIPPEYSNAGNNYKSHLFSLGMTLLYAAEYNVDNTTEEISSELRDLLGRMTADSYKSRPDLESVITLCEEQLCGQSSQEVCCGIAAIAGFGLPIEDQYIHSEATYIDATSPDDFSHADTYAHSEQGDTTCYDDIPDLTEDISQAESLPFSEQEELVSEQCADPGGSDMESIRRRKVSPQSGKSAWGLTDSKDSVDNKSKPKTDKPGGKPAIPEKPKSLTNSQVENIAISELPSESDSEGLSVKQTIVQKPSELVTVTEMDYSEATDINQNLTASNGTANTDTSNTLVNGDANSKSGRKSKERSNGHRDSKKSSFSEKSKSKDKVSDVTPDSSSATSLSKAKRTRRKQGFTIAELLEALERHLEEPELWALCKEGIAALQRKKKHLPAYLSPDTLLIREPGTVSFKAIPEEKPLEVIFMAPELQSKGELSEKTCLYGLSVTLRCAAGKKYAQVSSMKVCTEMKDLLRSLSDTEPSHRPELAEVAKICMEYCNGTGSEVICSKLFQEALDTLVERESQKENSSQQLKTGLKDIKDDILPKVAKPSAFKPIPGSSFQPIKPTAFGSESGAFAPVPKKLSDKENAIPEPRIPSAFSSPATHFKPIVLQQTSISEKPAPVKEEPAIEKDQDVKTSTPQKRSSPDNNGDKDKEVVKKLKELKKNLMKHRQPTLAKDLENEDKTDTKGSQSASSTLNKKSSSGSKKSGSSRSGDRPRKRSSVSGEALDSLLKEIQKQGQVPDTNSLASAIAQYLQEHLGQGKKSETKPPPPQQELDMTVTSGPNPGPSPAQALPNLNIPAQYHPQLVGQTMTLPMQYGGSMFAGFPQVQLQQDPVTGYIQLVPVNIVPMRPPSNAGSVHSNTQHEPMVSPALGSRSGSGSGRSPHPSPKFPNKLNQNDSFTSAISNKSDPSSNKGKVPPHGRTARDLVNKTANLRAKNLGRNSARSLLNVPGESGFNGLQKWKSDHALHSAGPDEFYTDGETIKRNSVSNIMGKNANLMYDDMLLHHRSLAQYGIHPGLSNYRSPEIHNIRTHSNSSSPSPSKDSGVSGMNFGGFRGYGMETSLMDRLLNNVNVKQQRSLGRIVHLLREEFAFDGYMENGVEDLAMAEYISSLGDLKWETFTSAISEKYSDLYWGTELLANLYNAVNGARPLSGSRTHTGPKIPLESQSLQRADSSSSHSDQNSRNRSAKDRLRPGLSPLSTKPARPHSAQVGNQLDTSDSTDTENYGKRRKFKTKHQLDKTKSSSDNQLVDNVPEMNNESKTGPDSRVINVLPNDISIGTSPKTSGDPSKQYSDSGGEKLHNISAEKLAALSPSTSTVTTENQQSPKSAYNSNSSYDSSNTNSHQKNIANIQNGQVNSLSPNPAGRLSREVSVSSHSSSQSDLTREGDGTAVEKKGHVVYHWAMIQLSMTPEVERFMQDIDEQNQKIIMSKLTDIEQQIKLEKRTRRKTQRFYKNLRDTNKGHEKHARGERSTIDQVTKDITEMTHKIRFLDLCKTHLQMLLAELQGIDVSYLHAIAMCAPGEPLQLRPRPDNPLLQFQTLREPHTGCEIQALHAGTPEGLMAYLFASTALSDGYIHQFLFCYRYFTVASEVLDFLINRYNSASRAGSTEVNIGRLQQRVVDMLHFWLEGYYSIDFHHNTELLQTLRNFIKDHIKEDSEGGQSLLMLLSSCSHGNNLELSSADPDESEMHFWQREEPKQRQSEAEKGKEWDSFKSLVKGKTGAKKTGKVKISAVVVERRRRSDTKEEIPQQITSSSRRSDSFTLSDFTAQTLAEQLCLIEQGIFQLTHPVHYLDSKFRGVGVAMTMKGLRTPSVARKSGVDDIKGLFVEPLVNDSAIKRMLDHADEVSHWVAGEIVACSNPKTQIDVLSKFLFTAQSCMELRNFATCMAVLDGLENLIVKQLPAWKHLPSKCITIKEALESTRMFLKNDPMSLMQQGKDCHLYPTIPSVIYFLLHVQQLEIGGFKLANQMYKWGKMRSIAQVIDQVRIFREHVYGFEPNNIVQDALRHRIREMNAQDIHMLASQHEINYQKMSGSRLSGAFRKVKGKLQSK